MMWLSSTFSFLKPYFSSPLPRVEEPVKEYFDQLVVHKKANISHIGNKYREKILTEMLPLGIHSAKLRGWIRSVLETATYDEKKFESTFTNHIAKIKQLGKPEAIARLLTELYLLQLSVGEEKTQPQRQLVISHFNALIGKDLALLPPDLLNAPIAESLIDSQFIAELENEGIATPLPSSKLAAALTFAGLASLMAWSFRTSTSASEHTGLQPIDPPNLPLDPAPLANAPAANANTATVPHANTLISTPPISIPTATLVLPKTSENEESFKPHLVPTTVERNPMIEVKDNGTPSFIDVLPRSNDTPLHANNTQNSPTYPAFITDTELGKQLIASVETESAPVSVTSQHISSTEPLRPVSPGKIIPLVQNSDINNEPSSTIDEDVVLTASTQTSSTAEEQEVQASHIEVSGDNSQLQPPAPPKQIRQVSPFGNVSQNTTLSTEETCSTSEAPSAVHNDHLTPVHSKEPIDENGFSPAIDDSVCEEPQISALSMSSNDGFEAEQEVRPTDINDTTSPTKPQEDSIFVPTLSEVTIDVSNDTSTDTTATNNHTNDEATPSIVQPHSFEQPAIDSLVQLSMGEIVVPVLTTTSVNEPSASPISLSSETSGDISSGVTTEDAPTSSATEPLIPPSDDTLEPTVNSTVSSPVNGNIMPKSQTTFAQKTSAAIATPTLVKSMDQAICPLPSTNITSYVVGQRVCSLMGGNSQLKEELAASKQRGSSNLEDGLKKNMDNPEISSAVTPEAIPLLPTFSLEEVNGCVEPIFTEYLKHYSAKPIEQLSKAELIKLRQDCEKNLEEGSEYAKQRWADDMERLKKLLEISVISTFVLAVAYYTGVIGKARSWCQRKVMQLRNPAKTKVKSLLDGIKEAKLTPTPLDHKFKEPPPIALKDLDEEENHLKDVTKHKNTPDGTPPSSSSSSSSSSTSSSTANPTASSDAAPPIDSPIASSPPTPSNSSNSTSSDKESKGEAKTLPTPPDAPPFDAPPMDPPITSSASTSTNSSNSTSSYKESKGETAGNSSLPKSPDLLAAIRNPGFELRKKSTANSLPKKSEKELALSAAKANAAIAAREAKTNTSTPPESKSPTAEQLAAQAAEVEKQIASQAAEIEKQAARQRVLLETAQRRWARMKGNDEDDTWGSSNSNSSSSSTSTSSSSSSSTNNHSEDSSNNPPPPGAPAPIPPSNTPSPTAANPYSAPTPDNSIDLRIRTSTSSTGSVSSTKKFDFSRLKSNSGSGSESSPTTKQNAENPKVAAKTSVTPSIPQLPPKESKDVPETPESNDTSSSPTTPVVNPVSSPGTVAATTSTGTKVEVKGNVQNNPFKLNDKPKVPAKTPVTPAPGTTTPSSAKKPSNVPTSGSTPVPAKSIPEIDASTPKANRKAGPKRQAPPTPVTPPVSSSSTEAAKTSTSTGPKVEVKGNMQNNPFKQNDNKPKVPAKTPVTPAPSTPQAKPKESKVVPATSSGSNASDSSISTPSNESTPPAESTAKKPPGRLNMDMFAPKTEEPKKTHVECPTPKPLDPKLRTNINLGALTPPPAKTTPPNANTSASSSSSSSESSSSTSSGQPPSGGPAKTSGQPKTGGPAKKSDAMRLRIMNADRQKKGLEPLDKLPPGE